MRVHWGGKVLSGGEIMDSETLNLRRKSGTFEMALAARKDSKKMPSFERRENHDFCAGPAEITDYVIFA
jgi:hypothetical protein